MRRWIGGRENADFEEWSGGGENAALGGWSGGGENAALGGWSRFRRMERVKRECFLFFLGGISLLGRP